MASFGSRNSRCTLSGGTSISATPSSNVHVYACSSGLRYKLYPVEVLFPSPEELWVFDDHLPPKMIAAIFNKRIETEEFED